jgi:AcrR family transcriptional regulator
VRHAILSAAKRLLKHDIYAELSISTLSQAAGVSYTTVSRGWEGLRSPIAMLRAVQMMDRLDVSDLESFSDPLGEWMERFSGILALDRLRPQDLLDFLQALDAVIRVRLQELVSSAEPRGLVYPRIDDIVVKLVAPVVYSRLVGNGASATRSIEEYLDQ